MNIRLTSILALIFFFMCDSSCHKPVDQASPNTPSGPTNPSIPGSPPINDSVRLLTSVNGNFDQGAGINLEYNDKNQLIQLNNPYTVDMYSPYLVFYKNNIISHIAVSTDKTASAIFTYNANNTCSKVYFKKADYNKPPTDAFFGDLTDGNFIYIDSLTYAANGRLQEIYKYNVANGVASIAILDKFYYSDASDTSLNRIEEYFYRNGVPVLNDQLILRTNTIKNPAYGLLWFFPFTHSLSQMVSKPHSTYLPFLFDGPSSGLGMLAVYSARCIASYEVNNSFGLYNYHNSQFTYTFTADSLRMTATKTGDHFGLNVKYTFSKQKK